MTWRLLGTVTIAAGILVGCTKSITVQAPTPATPDAPPSAAPVARLALSISGGDAQVLLAEQSVVTLDARGSSGTGLRYSLDFGDGQGADTAVATHRYPVARRVYRVRAVVTDATGRTDEATLQLTVSDATGRWSSYFYNPRTKDFEGRDLVITAQAGGVLTGRYVHPNGDATPIQGELTGERGFHLVSPDRFIEFTSAPEGIDRYGRTVEMTVRGGSADGVTLLFHRDSTL